MKKFGFCCQEVMDYQVNAQRVNLAPPLFQIQNSRNPDRVKYRALVSYIVDPGPPNNYQQLDKCYFEQKNSYRENVRWGPLYKVAMSVLKLATS